MTNRLDTAPTLISVSDTFHVTNRGTVVLGYLSSGIVKLGDEIEILDSNPTQTATIIGILLFDEMQLVNTLEASQKCGILLKGIKQKDIQQGKILVTQNATSAYNKSDISIHPMYFDPDVLTAVFHGVHIIYHKGKFIGFNPISKQEINIYKLSTFSASDLEHWKNMHRDESSKYVRNHGENINPFNQYDSLSIGSSDNTSLDNSNNSIMPIFFIIIISSFFIYLYFFR